MTGSFDADLARRAEQAHYRLQSALFFRDRWDVPGALQLSPPDPRGARPGASLFSAGEITDPDWNHAGLVALDPARLGAMLALAKRYFHARGLPAAVAVSPFSEPRDLEARLVDLGFVPCFRHGWHFVGRRPGGRRPGSTPVPAVALPDGSEIRAVANEGDMRAFVEVFETVYSVDLETGEPEELPRGYGQALLGSFREPRSDVDVVHYLATVGGEPAGIATAIHGETMSGLYNLAVLPGFRRRGLGGALVRRRALDALTRGREAVFLQTEGESVARRLVRHGFTKRFTTVGLVERES
jgi:GNAT superfamily N-acetyltransferase